MPSDKPYGLYVKIKHDTRDTADKLYECFVAINYSKKA